MLHGDEYLKYHEGLKYSHFKGKTTASFIQCAGVIVEKQTKEAGLRLEPFHV